MAARRRTDTDINPNDMIVLDHVSKSYTNDRNPALNDVSLVIERGEFVFIVGD